LRKISGLIAIAALLFSVTATFAAPVQGKRHVIRRWYGYGFLPGYRSPERINGNRRRIGGRPIGRAAPAFTGDVGRAVASAHAGHRRRSATYGTAVDKDRGQSWPGRVTHPSPSLTCLKATASTTNVEADDLRMGSCIRYRDHSQIWTRRIRQPWRVLTRWRAK
jgi:hypothetical protein